jgi:hypothetical protein
MAIAKLSIDLETRLATFERDLKQMSALSEMAANKIGSAFTGLTVIFAGLAGALSVGAIKQAFDSYVQGAAAMDDLAEITGSTVEKVSALSNVAKISGTDMGLLEGGMVKLAKAVTLVGDESSDAAAAFKALNLDPKELGAVDTADQLKIVAERLAEYEDGAAKTALATTLLGKSGAQLLPYLKDLASTGDLVAKVTTEQAAQAEEYEKNLKRLGAAQSAVVKIISAELVPAANVLVKTFVDVLSGTDGVRGAARGLAEDGSIQNWAISAVRAAGFVIDAFDGVVRVVQAVGKTIGAAAASAAAVAQGSFSGAKAIGGELLSDLDSLAQKPLFSQRLEENIAAMQKLGGAADVTRKKLNFSGGVGGGAGGRGGRGRAGGGASASFTDYDQQLVQRIASAIEKTDTVKAAELVRQLEKLDELAAAGLDPAIVKAVRDDLTGASKAAADEVARLNSLLDATPTAKIEQSRDDMLLLTKALTEGRIAEEQYLEAVAARLDTVSKKTEKVVGEFDEFTEAAAKNIENALADFLFDPFSEGLDGMARKFADTIRKMAADAAAAQIAKALFGGMGKDGDWGWVGSIIKAVGFHEGGLVGAGGSFSRNVPAAAFFSAKRYHNGGFASDEVPAILQKGELVLTKDQQKATANQSAPAPAQNIRIVNAFDTSVVGDYLGSAAGERLILNAVQRNSRAMRQAIA